MKKVTQNINVNWFTARPAEVSDITLILHPASDECGISAIHWFEATTGLTVLEYHKNVFEIVASRQFMVQVQEMTAARLQ